MTEQIETINGKANYDKFQNADLDALYDEYVKFCEEPQPEEEKFSSPFFEELDKLLGDCKDVNYRDDFNKMVKALSSPVHRLYAVKDEESEGDNVVTTRTYASGYAISEGDSIRITLPDGSKVNTDDSISIMLPDGSKYFPFGRSYTDGNEIVSEEKREELKQIEFEYHWYGKGKFTRNDWLASKIADNQ